MLKSGLYNLKIIGLYKLVNYTILFSIIVLLIYRLFKLYLLSNKDYIAAKKNLLLSIFLPVFSIVIIYTLMVTSNFKKLSNVILSIIICLGLIFMNIYLIKIFEIFHKNAEFKSYINASEHLSKAQLSYYKKISNKNDELARHIHDTKRHMQMIKKLYESQKYIVAKKYIDSVYKNYNNNSKVFKSKNIVLDILINEKIDEASSCGIDLIVNDSSTGMLFFDNIDLVLLFSNLIDNAIDATLNCDSNKVYVIIDKHNNFTCLSIQNNYDEIKKNSKGHLLSTKNGHLGYGLDIVSEVVKKYGGTMDIKCNTVFIVNIMFPQI